MSMIKLEQVSKIYNNDGVTAIGIQNVSIEFNLGEFVAITGESGSGKSTMLNVISMMDSYEEGELFIDDRSTVDFSKADFANYRANYVSFIFQEYNLVDSFTVLDNVMLPLLSRGYSRKEAKRIALESIDKVGLNNVKHHKATHLSGGEKQRTVIARALVSNTPIIACDEPTGNLDSETAVQIINLLKEVAPNKLILYVTHDFDSIKDVATRKIVMSDSHLIEDTSLRPYNEDIQIENVGKAKTKFPTVLSLGLKDVVSTPKKSFLSLLIASVISLSSLGILVGAFSLITPASKNITTVRNAYADKAHFQNNRVVAFGKGKNGTELASIDMPDDVFTDWGSILASQSHFEIHGENARAPFSEDINDISLIRDQDQLIDTLGRAPENESEFALGVSEERFNEFVTDRDAMVFFNTRFLEPTSFKISTSSLRSSIRDYKVKPVGVYLISDLEDDFTLLFNKAGLNKFYLALSEEFATRTSFSEGETNSYTKETIFTINGNYVAFDANGYNMLKVGGSVDYSKIYISEEYEGFDLTMRLRNAEITIAHNDPRVVFTDKLYNCVFMHLVQFDLLLANSKQVASFYTTSAKAADNVNKILLSHSFLSYRSDTPQSSIVSMTTTGYQNLLLIVAYSVAFIVSSILIAFLGSLILGVIYNSRKKDYAIYLSLSFSNTVVRLINGVEMFLFFLITSVLSYASFTLISGVVGKILHTLSLQSDELAYALQGFSDVLNNSFKFATSPLFIVIFFVFNILFGVLVSTWIMNKFMKKTLANNLRKGGELL